MHHDLIGDRCRHRTHTVRPPFGIWQFAFSMRTMTSFLLTAVLACIAGLSAAAAAEIWLKQHIPLLGSGIGLTLSHNAGIAFGLHLGSAQHVLIMTALVAVTILALRTVRSHATLPHAGTRLSAVGYGLIVGGAFSNILDRLHDGVVTDFIQIGTFPVFNVADSCITVGVMLVLAGAHMHTRSQR